MPDAQASIDWTGALEADTARISTLIRTSDLGTPVAHLGRWKVRDVAAHLGGVHRWATRTIVARSRDVAGATKSKLDGHELCDWFDEGAAELIDTLRSADMQAECPNFNPGSPRTIEWWARRQTHETAVHRWDIECALDRVTPIGAELARDGVDEYLDVFVRTRGKQTLTAPLRLTSTDPDQSWALTPASKPGRVDIDIAAASPDHPEISGPPDQLLLYLSGRLALADAGLTVAGDLATAQSLRRTGSS